MGYRLDVVALMYGRENSDLSTERVLIMTEENHTRDCIICGDEVAHDRWALGYKTCMPCGQAASKKVKHCIVNMNKVAYMVVTDREILKQLNPKRTT